MDAKEGKMAIDERSRHVLFQKLENVLGGDEASSLMEYLPPVGWADVATKQDIENVRVGMNHLGKLMERDFRAVVTKDQFRRSLMAAVFSLMGFFVALSAVLVAAIRI